MAGPTNHAVVRASREFPSTRHTNGTPGNANHTGAAIMSTSGAPGSNKYSSTARSTAQAVQSAIVARWSPCRVVDDSPSTGFTGGGTGNGVVVMTLVPAAHILPG